MSRVQSLPFGKTAEDNPQTILKRKSKRHVHQQNLTDFNHGFNTENGAYYTTIDLFEAAVHLLIEAGAYNKS